MYLASLYFHSKTTEHELLTGPQKTLRKPKYQIGYEHPDIESGGLSELDRAQVGKHEITDFV